MHPPESAVSPEVVSVKGIYKYQQHNQGAAMLKKHVTIHTITVSNHQCTWFMLTIIENKMFQDFVTLYETTSNIRSKLMCNVNTANVTFCSLLF